MIKKGATLCCIAMKIDCIFLDAERLKIEIRIYRHARPQSARGFCTKIKLGSPVTRVRSDTFELSNITIGSNLPFLRVLALFRAN